jgi:hypothetical protein
MSATTNGHAPALAVETINLGDAAGSRPRTGTGTFARKPGPRVRGDDDPVAELAAQVAKARGLVELQDDDALQQALSSRERQAARKVTEKIRAVELRERKRAGVERARAARQVRADERWSARARRGRERLLNPNRRLAATYRRYVALSTVTATLVVAGVAWMSTTVHHGLVGPDGTWLAYLVEPLASVLLVVSMVAQFTAIEHGENNPKWFLWLDAGLATASLVLNLVPWGLRYGWAAGEILAHAWPPLLVAAAVVVHHMLNRLFSAIFVNLHDELSPTRLGEQTADVLVLYERTKREIAKGRIAVGDEGIPSREAIRKTFGVGKIRAQWTGDAFEVVRRALPDTP